MDLFDVQTTLTVAVILTATAVIVFFDYLRKNRQRPQPHLVKSAPGPKASRLAKSALASHSTRIFESAPVDYAAAKKLAAERPLEPLVAVSTHSRTLAEPAPERPLEVQPLETKPLEALVGIATASRPHIEPRIERDTVTVSMAPTSPSAPPGPVETRTSLATLQTFALPEFTIDAALWERLISTQPKRNLLSSVESDPTPIHKTPAAPISVHTRANTIEANFQMIQDPNYDVPAENQPRGMIQQPVLDKWLESEQRYTGLVVSIGINDSDSSMWHSQGLMQSVGNYIAGLLKAKDYCCRTAYDEFVIVCPGEQGPHAQRRLNHISERLWDYQLRGIGAVSILFSWGGVQVQDEPLAEAMASATERMRETKRSGPAKSAVAHRQAV